jgi:hypothetical protein
MTMSITPPTTTPNATIDGEPVRILMSAGEGQTLIADRDGYRIVLTTHILRSN